MQQIALHTRLRPDRVAEYERVHAVIPRELDGALRDAGVRSWTIWRDGLELFHVIDVEDWHAMEVHLSTSPADIRWQALIGELLQQSDSNGPLTQVWTLPAEGARAQ